MTVASVPRLAGPFIGNGVTTSFPFAFKVFTKADVQAVSTVTATGVQAVLVLDSDYSVTLNADQDTSPGGTVDYPISGTEMPATQTLTLVGSLPLQQQTDISNAGSFLPQVLEDALDYDVILVQQAQEQLDRSLHMPVGDTTSTLLPNASVRANGTLVFDADGAATVSDIDFAALAAAAAGSVTAAAAQADAAAASAAEAAGYVDIILGGQREQYFTGPGPWVLAGVVNQVLGIYINGVKQRMYMYSIVDTGDGKTVSGLAGSLRVAAGVPVDIVHN